MKQEFALSLGFQIFPVAHLVRRNVKIIQDYIVAINSGETARQARLLVSEGFDFTAYKDDPSLHAIFDKIVTPGFAVSGDNKFFWLLFHEGYYSILAGFSVRGSSAGFGEVFVVTEGCSKVYNKHRKIYGEKFFDSKTEENEFSMG